MNSDLKNKTYVCPDEVISELEIALASYQSGGDTKGYKRAKNIVDNPKISYQQMKRMKNYFDHYEGDGTDEEFKLNGGSLMKKWVNKALGDDRENLNKIKSAQRDGGKDNAFIKTHEKDNNKDPMNVNVPKIKGGETRYENEIKQIQYLIEYLDNNKKII